MIKVVCQSAWRGSLDATKSQIIYAFWNFFCLTRLDVFDLGHGPLCYRFTLGCHTCSLTPTRGVGQVDEIVCLMKELLRYLLLFGVLNNSAAPVPGVHLNALLLHHF